MSAIQQVLVGGGALAIGDIYGGGFYAGKIIISGTTYALVIAPKATGQQSAKVWKTTNSSTAGTSSLSDGLANSNAMNNATHPSAQFCRGLSIGGFADWYLPSRDELELCYRNLKPTTTPNTVNASPNTSGNGYNANSSPVGAAYTAGNPAVTALSNFASGGSEAFDVVRYWSSTETGTASLAWSQEFSSGSQDHWTKDSGQYARAVRKVAM